MEQETQCLTLPARLDATAGRRLAADLRAHMGRPLRIDASAVEIVSGLALEALVSAMRQWVGDGHAFVIEEPSVAFRAGCRTLALEDVLTAPASEAAPA